MANNENVDRKPDKIAQVEKSGVFLLRHWDVWYNIRHEIKLQTKQQV